MPRQANPDAALASLHLLAQRAGLLPGQAAGPRQREHGRYRPRAAVQRPHQHDSGQRHVSRKISTVSQKRDEVITTPPGDDRERTGERDPRDFPQRTRRDQRSWRRDKVTR
jgi:hypothetical protein